MMAKFNPVFDFLATFFDLYNLPQLLTVNLGYGMKLQVKSNM
jgi:hypothetical protein